MSHGDDSLVACAVAQLFCEWRIDKPQWFDCAVSAAPDLGDTWGWWLKFEHQHNVSKIGAARVEVSSKNERMKGKGSV